MCITVYFTFVAGKDRKEIPQIDIKQVSFGGDYGQLFMDVFLGHSQVSCL